MSHAFISYAREDLQTAELVEAKLNAEKVATWMDTTNLPLAQKWMEEIDRQLDLSSWLIVIVTPTSLKSHYVTYECARARGRNIPLIPLIFETNLDPHPWIRELQCLDFSNLLYRRWDKLLGLLKPSAVSVRPPVPKPPRDFKNFVLGNIELPVMPLTGSPLTPYKMTDVKVQFQPILHEQELEYPLRLRSAKPYLLDQYKQRYQYTDETLPRNPMVRIADWKQDGETEANAHGSLSLNLEITTFDAYLATNRSLDYEVLPKSNASEPFRMATLREEYVRFPYDIRDSVLANPLAVMVVLMSRNADQSPRDQIIVQHRGGRVASYRNRYQVSAAGYVSLAHTDGNDRPNPFITAVSEAREELGDSLASLHPEDFNLIGLACSWVDMLPLIYGYCVTPTPARKIIGDLARDGYEGRASSLPFRPQEVLRHLSENKWTPDGAFAVCAALLAFYRRSDIDAVADTLPFRGIDEYFE